MTLIDQVVNKIKQQFLSDSSGHDWYHIKRVWNLSKYLQKKEGGNLEIIELAALLHDISDYKLNGGKLYEGGKVARKILEDLNVSQSVICQVEYIVNNVGYKGAQSTSKIETLEGKIVQDADRLDAMGAIGIARTFAYGGHKQQPIYLPGVPPKKHQSFEDYANSRTTTINHFYEKLLLLKDQLNTNSARKIGEEKHQLMEDFLASFFTEWNTTYE